MNDIAVIADGEVYTEESYQQRLREQQDGLHAMFVKMRDQWIHHRAQSGVERRWKAAMELYYGDQDEQVNRFVETLEMGPRVRNAETPARSKVVVNIVRPKCDQATARMAEILLPVDDRNWAIKPTPVPEIVGRIGDQRETFDPQTGQPTGLTADQEAQVLLEEARERAKRMQDHIDDNLTECNYNGELRSVLQNGVILGTGVIKGPFPINHENRAWIPREDGTHELHFTTEVQPASQSLDPWNVYFDPACGTDHQCGRGVFERVPNVTRKDLRRLAKVPGYDADRIAEVLRASPKKVSIAEGRVGRTACDDGSYEMWIYHGDIEADEMGLLTAKREDPLTDVSFGVLVMVNDVIIGAMESWVVDHTLPYDVWCWRKSDDSPYGYGLPDELSHQQRVVNAAWRQVMDNAKFSMGGQIVMKKGKVIPADGKWEISPGKLWYAKDDMDDVRHAFSVFEFASHIEELMSLVTSAMALADTETSMPQILGGERGSAPETVGGMVMLYNNANAVLRMRVKLFDDCVTKPHISRYYDFHMANNTDASAKGDFDIDARGSSALVERDLQNQAMINLSAITSNPRYAGWVKEKEELRAIFRAFKLDPEELMKTDEEYQQEQEALAQQGAPQDPRIMSAQMQLEAKQLELQDRQVQREFEMQRNAQELEIRKQTLAYNQQREEMEFQLGSQQSQLQREIAIAKMIQDGELTQAELEAKERLEKIKIADGRERFNAEMYVKQTQGSGI